MTDKDYDILHKIIIVGDSGVGKSGLVNKFIRNKYSKENVPTIGVEFFFKNLSRNNIITKLQIWNTAGQENTDPSLILITGDRVVLYLYMM